MSTSKAKQACILAVGTELTTGQIINRNAPWIAERLTNLGIEVVLHETVADDRMKLAEALKHCAKLGDLLFVTGGLGPTSDDFTRDLICAWVGQPAEFDEASWKHITERLGRFGIRVAESNRQQCYFPRGSFVLTNPEGTANAFFVAHGSTQAWVLPGPPREIAAVWESALGGLGMDGMIRERVPGLRPLELLTWQCLGKSEAELGEITERTLRGSGLAIGYRAHRPFVEVKVWLEPEKRAIAQPWIEKLEAAIGPWVATRQGEDLAARLLKELRAFDEIELIDSATGGILGERLGALLREAEHAELAPCVTMATEWSAPVAPDEWVSGLLSQADEGSLTLAIAGFTPDGAWALGMRHGETVRVSALQSPWKGSELADRSRRYSIEVALKQWHQWLAQSVH